VSPVAAKNAPFPAVIGPALVWVMHTEKLSLRKAVEGLRGEPGDNPAWWTFIITRC